MKHFDLSQLDTTQGAEQGYELELRHPATHEPLGIFIEVIGADSEAYIERRDELQRARLAQMQKSRRLMPTPGELKMENIELLTAASRAWYTKDEAGNREPGLPLGGQRIPFSGKEARAVYQKYHWIREQVDDAVGERANFLPRSAPASSPSPSINSGSTVD